MNRIGFTCAYTPLPLIDAAGFTPTRILPLGGAPDEAGRIAHENLCPHVKRVLDRALADDLPPLAGVVFMNSCETMRRLADAWRFVRLPAHPRRPDRVRPDQRVVLVDLPAGGDRAAVGFFAGELAALGATLTEWSGRALEEAAIARSIAEYDRLAGLLGRLEERAAAGRLPGGRAALQRTLNASVTSTVAQALAVAQAQLDEGEADAPAGVPVVLTGNVLPDPAALALFEELGCRILDADLCTGTRQLAAYPDAGGDVYERLAAGLLARPACARTLRGERPGAFAADAAALARRRGAAGVIAHVMKFCDPYVARLPALRAALSEAGLPLLVLEGDCTLRSLGQQRTRIEAFVEMLGGGR